MKLYIIVFVLLFLTSCKALDKLAEKSLYAYSYPNKEFPVDKNPPPDYVTVEDVFGSEVWYVLHKDTRPVIMYYYGNAESLRSLNHSGMIKVLNDLGDFIVMEYPKYGKSTGELSEQEIVSRSVFIYQRTKEILHKPIIIWGRSLGSAIAMEVAWYVGDFDRLLLVSPWSDLKKLIMEVNPLGKYVSEEFYKKNRYMSVEYAKRTIGRSMVIHGSKDTFIKPEHGKAMAEALFGELILIDAEHNDLYNKQEAWDNILRFLK